MPDLLAAKFSLWLRLAEEALADLDGDPKSWQRIAIRASAAGPYEIGRGDYPSAKARRPDDSLRLAWARIGALAARGLEGEQHERDLYALNLTLLIGSVTTVQSDIRGRATMAAKARKSAATRRAKVSVLRSKIEKIRQRSPNGRMSVRSAVVNHLKGKGKQLKAWQRLTDRQRATQINNCLKRLGRTHEAPT